MKTKCRIFFIGFCWLISVAFAFPQTSEGYAEKVYLHTDQSHYVVGEIIWFAAYGVEKHSLQPISGSSSVFIELIDGSGKPVIQTRIALINGRGSGSMKIPSITTSGQYRLRAYTAFMKNGDAADFFYQSVLIVNPFEPAPVELLREPALPLLTFHTPGDSMISQVENKIGFVFHLPANSKRRFSVSIVDETGITATNFKSSVQGVGYFLLTPGVGKRYSAVISDSSGTVGQVALPFNRPSGISAYLNEDATQVYAHLNTVTMTSEKFTVQWRAGEQLLSETSLTVSAGTTTISMPKDQLHHGMNRFILRNSRGKIVHELDYFVYPKDLSIEVTPSSTQAGTRTRVVVTLQTQEQANLSVSVSRRTSIAERMHQNSLASYLHVGASLSGTPWNLRQYHAEHSRGMLQDFIYAYGHHTPKEQTHRYLPEIYGPVLEGIATQADGSPVSHELLFASVPSRYPSLFTAMTDHQGHVQFAMNNIVGDRLVVLQRASGTAPITFTPTNPFSTEPVKHVFSPVYLTEADSDDLTRRSISMQVNNLYYQSQLEAIAAPADTLAFYGIPDQVYDLDDYTRFPTMEEVAREFLAKVTLRKTNGKSEFILIDQEERRLFDTPPLLLIDGVVESSSERILAFDPQKIKRIDIVNRKHYYGELVFNGILSLRTYDGDLQGYQPAEQAAQIRYLFPQPPRLFYSPVHQPETYTKPDQRVLLYWNPQVTTDRNGKAVIEFYTSDVTGTFDIHVDGMSTTGVVGSTTTTLMVEERKP
jgi:hypothetical protein